MIEQGSKVLISTNRPSPGGVQVMLKFVIDCLLQRDCQITIAYYQPYSVTPQLSVPLQHLLTRRPGFIEDQFDQQDCVGVGCWLPELEVTHYRSSKVWERLIHDNQVHLVVGGSCQPANIFLQNKIPFLAWVASDWQGDRQHRVQEMPWLRRLIDRVIVSPLAKKIERKIIESNQLLALSESTKMSLNAITGKPNVKEVLPIAVDTDHFKAAQTEQKKLKIGFVGRFEDPRKNIKLLFDAFVQIVKSHPQLELCLIGDHLTTSSQEYLHSLGVASKVEVIPYADRSDLPAYLNQFTVFVLPSYQEGLCIAALEAMACEVPVVSTRCGGPENFIDDRVNGALCGFNASEMADAVSQILSDDELRMRYASAARNTVVNQYSEPVQRSRFWALLDQSF